MSTDVTQPAPSSMLAARVHEFGPPAVLRVEQVPIPAPGDGEVLLRVRAAAVTNLDTYLRAGVKVEGYTPTPPYTPGFSVSGEVVAVGSGVTALRAGQRVFGSAKGGYAEFALARPDRLYVLPEPVSHDAGAMIPVPYRTAYYSLFDLARAAGGETVLIHGASGSVGRAAVQLARAHGLRVVATCSPETAGATLQSGAHATIDYRASDWPAAVRAAAGRPIGVVLEVAAHVNLAADLELLAPGGRVVVIGGHGDTRIDMLPVISKGLEVLGVSLPRITPERDAQIMAAIVAGLENGTLRPATPKTYPLAEVAASHIVVEAGRGSGGVALAIHPSDPVR